MCIALNNWQLTRPGFLGITNCKSLPCLLWRDGHLLKSASYVSSALNQRPFDPELQNFMELSSVPTCSKCQLKIHHSSAFCSQSRPSLCRGNRKSSWKGSLGLVTCQLRSTRHLRCGPNSGLAKLTTGQATWRPAPEVRPVGRRPRHKVLAFWKGGPCHHLSAVRLQNNPKSV